MLPSASFVTVMACQRPPKNRRIMSLLPQF
ncbi:MAG: hypothetical protein ACI82A_001604 [Candidatus Azotimanducaceae bacterium]